MSHQWHRRAILGAPVGLVEVAVPAYMQHIATQVTNHGASVDHSCRSVLETAELLAGKYRDTNITQPAKELPPWTNALGCRKSPRGKDNSATALQTEAR